MLPGPLVSRPALLEMQQATLPLPAMDSGLPLVPCPVSTPGSIAIRSGRVNQASTRSA